MNLLEKKVEAVMRLCVSDNEKDRDRIREEIRQYLLHFDPGKMDPEQEIRRILLELGAPDHLVGHPYVIRGILLVMEDRMYINNITMLLYPKLAAEFDTTAARVERAIRHLIEVTWARGDVDVLMRYFGNTVSPDKGKPTNGEFIARLANVVKLRLREAA